MKVEPNKNEYSYKCVLGLTQPYKTGL